MTNPKLKVSVVILNWNTKTLLKDCLSSIRIQPKLDYEIVVVDNASTDGSSSMVKKDFPYIKLVENKKNVGFAAGNNQGLQTTTGDFVFFLNSDTVVVEESIEKLAQFLNQNKEVGAASPVIFNKDGTIQKDPCYLHLPSVLTSLFYYNGVLRKLSFKLFPFLLLSDTKFDKPVAVDQLPGAAMMIKKTVLQKTGGFDESFPLYFEDTDLSFRIRKLGYKLVVVPKTKIIHLGRKSIEPVVRQEGKDAFYFLNFNSLFLFCDKHYSSNKALLIKTIVLLHLLLQLKIGLIKKLAIR